jgi:hypothetical protein
LLRFLGLSYVCSAFSSAFVPFQEVVAARVSGEGLVDVMVDCNILLDLYLDAYLNSPVRVGRMFADITAHCFNTPE